MNSIEEFVAKHGGPYEKQIYLVDEIEAIHRNTVMQVSMNGNHLYVKETIMQADGEERYIYRGYIVWSAKESEALKDFRKTVSQRRDYKDLHASQYVQRPSEYTFRPLIIGKTRFYEGTPTSSLADAIRQLMDGE